MILSSSRLIMAWMSTNRRWQHGASDIERQPRRVLSTAVLDRHTDDHPAYIQCAWGSTIQQRISTAFHGDETKGEKKWSQEKKRESWSMKNGIWETESWTIVMQRWKSSDWKGEFQTSWTKDNDEVAKWKKYANALKKLFVDNLMNHLCLPCVALSRGQPTW